MKLHYYNNPNFFIVFKSVKKMSRGKAESKQLETRLHNQERFSLLHRIFPNEGQFYINDTVSYQFATFIIFFRCCLILALCFIPSKFKGYVYF
jgi:hypothetical protein